MGAELRTPSVWLPALGTALIQLAGTFGTRRRFPGLAAVPLPPYAVVLLLAGPVLLLARRRYPLPVLAGVLAVTVAYLHATHRPGPVLLALVIAFLTAASTGARWHTYPLPFIGWALFVWWRSPPVEAAGALGAWMLVLLAIAEGIRQRRVSLEAGRQRRAAMERDAASQARLTIARELHDVLAHSLSMINVQSAVALELLDTQPERAGPALSAIKDASRQAISDVHALVAALRTESGEPTAPTPGIADLDALVGFTRATGLTVTTTVRGRPRAVPAVIDSAAARIVQESLTNVVRHSTAHTATVTIGYGDDALEVTVDDDGRPAHGSGTGGSGIAGMRERAQALGGSLSAQRLPAGGFRVRAVLPVGGTP
ncbi:sensor histidine kinase [Mycolicibacterium cosmeticum]|uniref:histidine kinase n=1 Tax=Mycolicibacterium cosmeticum TaxID=258533 RepID=W9AYJ9_MYCCO|nr:sensor histidine kinase [Mycolicibacterium cosmeticum]TLH80436.1 sensor histidine kinase [Mycolicibacterium cosmeticum]CDO07646.1 two-component system sensor kinase [Mycolicibacterium cosmeticum]